MPLLLLKTKAQSPAPCGGALFICLALALWLPGTLALAQNLIKNPSFKKYTGQGLPCTYLIARKDAGDPYSPFVAQKDNFPGWNFTYLAGMACDSCDKKGYYIGKACNFKVIPFGPYNSHYTHLNKGQYYIKTSPPYVGSTALVLETNFQQHQGGSPDSIGQFREFDPKKHQTYETFISGQTTQPMVAGNKYFFSVWMSPGYTNYQLIYDAEDNRLDGIDIYLNYATSDFGFSPLAKSELDSFAIIDSLYLAHKIHQVDFEKYIERMKIDGYNPKNRLLQGNADSDWVELRLVFTASRDAQDFVFGYFPNNLYRIRNLTFEKIPNFNSYSLAGAIADTSSKRVGVALDLYYFADGFTLLPYPELGDTLYLAAGRSLTLDPRVPGARLRWHDGDTSPTKTIHCPGTYWVRSSSNFTSVADSVVVVARQPWPQDTLLCQPGARLALGAGAHEVAWGNGSSDTVLAIKAPGLYTVSFTMPGGCRYHIQTRVGLDSLRLPRLADTAFCDSGRIQVSPLPGQHYRWSTGDTTAALDIHRPGDYRLSVHNHNCSTQIGFAVDIERREGIPYADSSLCLGERFFLNPGISYHISYLSPEQAIYTDSADIVLAWTQPVCGYRTDTLRLRFRDCDCPAHLPNAISPNGDGLNEGFLPLFPCPLSAYHLRIFNRWGQEIFASDDPYRPWLPGTQALGAYFYTLSFKGLESRREHYISGTIHIIK